MPRYIVKLDGKYLEWSTVVDAPITYGMTLEEYREYYRDEYGREAFETNFEQRMKRVEEIGTSAHGYKSAEDVVKYNRAGPKETCLDLNEIIERYVRTDRGSDG